jgi:hypothetical protein
MELLVLLGATRDGAGEARAVGADRGGISTTVITYNARYVEREVPSFTPMTRSWALPSERARKRRTRALVNSAWSGALSLCHLYVRAKEMAQMVPCYHIYMDVQDEDSEYIR